MEVTDATDDAAAVPMDAESDALPADEDGEPPEEEPAPTGVPAVATPAIPRKEDWDPFGVPKESRNPSQLCVKRVQRDVILLCEAPLPGIFVVPDETRVTVVHALIS